MSEDSNAKQDNNNGGMDRRALLGTGVGARGPGARAGYLSRRDIRRSAKILPPV